jgi:hypothetical protein
VDYHGRRFLTVDQFISRAADLNIKSLRPNELEFYERNGLLLPTARTMESVTHARAVAQQQNRLAVETPTDLDPPIEWSRLEQSDPSGGHPFDREIGSNPFIHKPTRETFEPWNTRDIEIAFASGQRMKVPTIETYYDYWQVHIVELLRSFKYFEYAPFLRELPPDSSLRQFYEMPTDRTWARELRGMSRGYTAIARFSDVFQRAMENAHSGLKSDEALPDAAAAAVRDQLVAHAKRILQDAGLDEAPFYEFVIKVLDLMEDYERHERAALAADVERDLWLAQTFAYYAFGHDWSAFVSGCERHGGKQRGTTIRRLDPVEAARDEALQNLKYILQAGIGIASTTNEQEALPREWTDFCVNNELFETLKGVEVYSYSDREVRADRYPWFLYRRLRPLALAVEQLARAILEIANRPEPGEPMSALFTALARGEPWEVEYNRLLGGGYTSDKTRRFEQQVGLIQAMARPGDPEHLTIARTIILSIIARNLASHRNRRVADATVRVLAAACGRALAITWLLSRRAHIV